MEKSAEIKKDIADVLKAVLFSVLFSLAAVLLFALIVRWASLDDKAIVPVNYVIKVLSLFFGILLGFKNAQNGILKGAVSGLLYVLLSFLIFASLDGFKTASFSWIDLICLTVAGGIAGVIAVNIKSKRVKT